MKVYSFSLNSSLNKKVQRDIPDTNLYNYVLPDSRRLRAKIIYYDLLLK